MIDCGGEALTVTSSAIRGGVMFNRKTVFVLGAGASWHYGYPTGEGLVQKIATTAEQLREHFLACARQWFPPKLPSFVGPITDPSRPMDPWMKAAAKCDDLTLRLRQVNPLVIDYFLGHNPSVQDIGRLLICWVILASEERYLGKRGNPNRIELFEQSPFKRERESIPGLDIAMFKDDWGRFVLHKIAMGCSESGDLHKNNVSFVTFNYDVSLEYALHHGLNAMDTFKQQDVEQFLQEPRIIHCYGEVREAVDPPKRTIPFAYFFTAPRAHEREQALVTAQHQAGCLALLDEVFEASKRLYTIDPRDKITNLASMGVAREAIAQAEIVYVLGYGFDENNNARIGMVNGFGRGQKAVMFTNFGDINRVNKKAGRSVFGHPDVFLSGQPAFRQTTPPNYVEKSIRNVYEALELDFDELEDQTSAA